MANPLLTLFFIYFLGIRHTSTRIPVAEPVLTEKTSERTSAAAANIKLDFQIDTSRVPSKYTETLLTDLPKSVARRLEKSGVVSPLVAVSGDANAKHLLVELAGQEKMLDKYKKTVLNSSVLEFEEMNPNAGKNPGNPWLKTALNNTHFAHAEVQFDANYQPMVSISFDAEGAKLFEAFTEKNIGKPIAIFINGELISAPTVNEKIAGGVAVINGRYEIKTAQQMAEDLNSIAATLTFLK